MNNMDEVIRTIDLDKIYVQGKARIEAVKDVNLTIAKGQSTVIVGPSGAGKSTLLHMMGGLYRPTKGKVLFNGRDIYKMGDRERSRLRNEKIGFIFQFYNLLPEFTVLENVLLPSLMNRTRRFSKEKAKEKALALLASMGMIERIRHKPRQLSGGEAQRTAIARALVNEPDILFCDEPTGNLDSGMGEEIYGIIYSLSKENSMAIVVVTHHLQKWQSFDHKYYMHDGEIKPALSREAVAVV